jgi:RHS repeat-associated protein
VTALRVLLTLALIAFAVAPAAAQTETVEYYGLDALGSVRVIFDQNGQPIERMDYGPFGENLKSAIKMSFEQYAQLARDRESGQDYAEARNYSPATARFNLVDPVYEVFKDPQHWNRYAYARSSPLSLVDPDGRFPIPAAVAMFTLVKQLNDPNISTTVLGAAGADLMLPNPEFVGNDGWLDRIQAGLDVGSLALDATGVGATVSPFLDLTNGSISLLRGDFAGAGLSGLAAIPFLGAPANAARLGRHALTDTVANHLGDVTKTGRLARPYLHSPLTVEEIMAALPGRADPGGVPGALRWDVPGSFNGTNGIWELVVSEDGVILHFLFKGNR